ncbi:GNAT family N-acetyltransferase [Caldimonas tepidiphila]|uniref:GNAT family N-acetyltransferase n=1 Tax=Caldimonas tepidiphila TaxID=2315841 RepID=UPI000E5C235F|nr:GNAT family N-acetyltransferase [Caldimonas tepidiphila]
MRRAANPTDLEAVHAIYMHEAVVPFLGFDPMPLDDFRAVYRDLLASGGFFVWEAGGEVAGFYKAVRHPGRARHVAGLGTLAVAPRHHGSGVARAMVGDAIARLAAEGVLRVELMVESDNPRGIRFYEGLGFRIEGTLRKFYKRAGDAHFVDEHVMGLLLG